MPNLFALLTFVAYSIALVGVGLWASRKANAQGAFLIGDRGLGPWVAGLAYAASSSSAWVLLGYSGFVYAAGPSALWMAPGILAGYAAVWLFAGPILQRASREKAHQTLTDFLCEDASPDTRRAIQITASVLIAIGFSWYVAAQFQGAGLAFDDLFGTGLVGGVLIGAAITVAYVFLGGFLAVSLVDMLQGLLMAVVALVLPTIALVVAGGPGAVIAAMAEAPAQFADPFGGRAGWIAIGFVTGLFATGFGALGQPHLIAWIMATRDRKSRMAGAGVALGWGALVYLGMAVLGLSARALFGADAPPEGVFFRVATDHLPAILSGIVTAAVVSAIMSTVDSQLLVAGGAISHDLGLARRFPGRGVLVSRIAILMVCTAAVTVTLTLPASIFDRVLFAWTALGAAFGPTVVARALNYRPNGLAVLASILMGFTAAAAFEFVLPSGPGDVWARTVPWFAGGLGLLTPMLLPRLSAQNVSPS
ncbi:MAG: sodium/proline symporter [Pseudomonadota bacterium]